jgi:Na+-driven multidrug efflux pump
VWRVYLDAPGSSVAACLSPSHPSPRAQVSLQLFWFFSYFPEPLSITAQSLIARDMRQPARVQRVAKLLMGIAMGAGSVLAALVAAAYTFLPRLFTSDPLVMDEIRTLRPQVTSHLLLAKPH